LLELINDRGEKLGDPDGKTLENKGSKGELLFARPKII